MTSPTRARLRRWGVALQGVFRRYFVDHGEGSSGPFFAGVPAMGIGERTDPLNNDGYIPTSATPIWLKPFDLGVSQDLVIALPTDPETGEYVAQITLTRRSGTLENWKRLNRVFVSLLRTHFLHWRAVAEDDAGDPPGGEDRAALVTPTGVLKVGEAPTAIAGVVLDPSGAPRGGVTVLLVAGGGEDTASGKAEGRGTRPAISHLGPSSLWLSIPGSGQSGESCVPRWEGGSCWHPIMGY